MAHIHDPQGTLTLEFYRSTGAGIEINPSLAEAAGFALPVFFTRRLYDALTPDSVTSKYGINTRQNILDTLTLLHRLSRGAEEQTLVFETAVPRWNPRDLGFETKELRIAGTIFSASDGPFVIAALHGEGKDLLDHHEKPY